MTMTLADAARIHDGVVTPRADRPKRRTFTADYKAAILSEYDAADRGERGERGAILRREGLYSSHIVEWRKAAESGSDSLPVGPDRSPDCGEAARGEAPRGRPVDQALSGRFRRLRGLGARHARRAGCRPAGSTHPGPVRQGPMRGKITDLEEAFTGPFDDHHAFLLTKMLARIDQSSVDIADMGPSEERCKWLDTPTCGLARRSH